MNTRAAARAHLLISAQLAVGAASLAACAGHVLAGFAAAVVSGLVTGAAACAGSLFIRRRVFAHLDEAESEAKARGRAEGLSEGVLLSIATYQAAVFPLTGPAGVSDEERIARRTIAYRIAADDGLPHPVRTAAAAALEAIDHGQDRRSAENAVRALHSVVRLRPAD